MRDRLRQSRGSAKLAGQLADLPDTSQALADGTRYNLCEPHHIVHWEHGGPTDIENLCLLCGDCHHNQVHTKGARIEIAAKAVKPTLRHPRRDACTHTRATTARATINQPLRR